MEVRPIPHLIHFQLNQDDKAEVVARGITQIRVSIPLDNLHRAESYISWIRRANLVGNYVQNRVGERLWTSMKLRHSRAIVVAAVPETETEQFQKRFSRTLSTLASSTIGIFEFVTMRYTQRCLRNVLRYSFACTLARCQRRKRILSFH